MRLVLEEGRTGDAYLRRLRTGQSALRAGYARALGCEPDEVALTGGTHDGINTVLWGLHLRRRDEILTSDEEHAEPCSRRWRPVAKRIGVDVRVVPFDALAGEVGPRTRLVVCSHVSWLTGRMADVRQIVSSGVPVLLDGAQALGAVALDVHALGCDYYAASGQKWLCGPQGTGCLYVRVRRVRTLSPPWPSVSSLGDARDPASLVYHAGAQRFDTASPGGPLATWALAALEVLEDAGLAWVTERGPKLAACSAERLAEAGLDVAPRGAVDARLVGARRRREPRRPSRRGRASSCARRPRSRAGLGRSVEHARGPRQPRPARLLTWTRTHCCGHGSSTWSPACAMSRCSTCTRTSATTIPTASRCLPRICWRRWRRRARAARSRRCTSPTATRPPTIRCSRPARRPRAGSSRSAGWTRTPIRSPSCAAAWTPARAGSSCIRARSPSRCQIRRSTPIFAAAHERRLPVLIHAGRGIPALGRDAVAFARRYPDARIILAHGAICDLNWLWREIPHHRNLFIDTSWWNPIDQAALMSLIPPGHLLYATDLPYFTPYLIATMVTRYAYQVGLDDRQVASILGGQAERVLAGDEPLDLGPAPGQAALDYDVRLERVSMMLVLALGRMLMGRTGWEPLSLARLACDLGDPDAPESDVCRNVLALLQRQEQLAKLDRNISAPFGPGIRLVMLAACIARTPDVALPRVPELEGAERLRQASAAGHRIIAAPPADAALAQPRDLRRSSAADHLVLDPTPAGEALGPAGAQPAG